MTVWGEIKNFRKSEFASPELMRTKLVRRLDLAREFAGVPFYLTSTYRDGDDGAHGRGWAVDVADNREGKELASRWRYKAVRGLLKAGFQRIGIYDRHIHCDLDPDRDPKVMWWGTSD